MASLDEQPLLSERSGGWSLGRASDFVVEIGAFSFQIELTLGYQPDESPFPQIHYGVIIEGAFTVGSGNDIVTIDPSDEPSRASPVLDLVRSNLRSLVVDAGGTLLLSFESAQIRVPADPSYEAWHINGPDDFKLVCAPGGDLMVWDALPDDRRP